MPLPALVPDTCRMRNPEQIILPAAAAVMLTAAAFISFARGAEVTAGDLAVISAWARATPPGADVAAAYVTVENGGSGDDRLTGIATPAATSTSIHETVEENGVATMRPLEHAIVPAGGRLEMAPGGIHVMLMGLTGPLVEGEMMPLTITFEHAGELTLDVTVAGMGADGPAGHQHPM